MFPSRGLRVFSILLASAGAVVAHPHPGNHLSHLVKRDSESGLWAGAYVEADDEQSFTGLSASFNSPEIKGNMESPFEVWISLGGIRQCPNVYLRAGVEIKPGNCGELSYKAYYIWHPRVPKQYLDLSVSAGDKIRVDIGFSNQTVSVVTIATARQNETRTLKATGQLCAEEATVAVAPQDPRDPIADFTLVEFNEVHTSEDTYSQPFSSFTLFDLVQNNKYMARVSGDGSSFQVKYL